MSAFTNNPWLALSFGALLVGLAAGFGIAAIRDANYILRRLRSLRRELRRQDGRREK